MKAHESARTAGEVSTSRLETLTDGIFAIAMTLLVFGLPFPVDASDFSHWLDKFLPSLLSFAVSFVIAGVFWVATHTEFQSIRRADHILIWLNIFFLLFIALIPFSAGLLGRYPSNHTAVIIYGVNLLLCLSMHYGMWWHATKGYRLVDANLDPRIVSLGTRLAMFSMVMYTAAIVLSFLSTWVSIVLYAVTPVPYILGLFYRPLWRLRRGVSINQDEESSM
jgi:uncharacterized membrane protein